jgi:hypothetical protein
MSKLAGKTEKECKSFAFLEMLLAEYLSIGHGTLEWSVN